MMSKKKSCTNFFNGKINMNINQFLHCKIQESDENFVLNSVYPQFYPSSQ